MQTHACAIDKLHTSMDMCSQVCIHSVPVGVCSGRHTHLEMCGFALRRGGGISGPWRRSEGS